MRKCLADLRKLLHESDVYVSTDRCFLFIPCGYLIFFPQSRSLRMLACE